MIKLGLVGTALVLLSMVAHAEDCRMVGWRQTSGDWVYYRAHMELQGQRTLRLRYDHKNGRIELSRSAGKLRGVAMFTGTWREDDGASGKVSLLMNDRLPVASGFTTNRTARGEQVAFQLGDCAHLVP